MNNVTKAYEFFCKYPGHTKTATIEVAERLGVSYDDVAKGRKHFNSGIRPDKKTKIKDKTEDLAAPDEDGSYTEYEEKINPNEQVKERGYETQYKEFLDKHGINEEDVTNVYFKEKPSGLYFTVQTRKDGEKELVKEQLYEFLSQYDYESSKPLDTYVPKDTFAVFNLFDAHIDKLSYTGKGGYWEAKENARYLIAESKKLLDDIMTYKPERVIFPIGNDFFNTNDAISTTKRGTYQQMTMHWQDSFQLGVWFYRVLIDMIAEHTKVHVINIPGNHDKDKVFHLGEVIKALYEDDDRVILNLNKDKRKYVTCNGVLLGFGHGDIAKKRIKDLPTTMAIEKPDQWGTANHRTWILGDIHHKEEYKSLQTLEHNGVDIKFLRPATDADQWHIDSMWIGAKKSISYILYRDNGTRIITDELFI